MIYPENFEEKVGFDFIRKLIVARCESRYSKDEAEAMAFTNDYDIIIRNLRQTSEMVDIITSDASFPLSTIDDISDYVSLLRSEGAYVSAQRLLSILAVLRVSESVKRFFEAVKDGDNDDNNSNDTRYPELRKISSRVINLSTVAALIEQTVNKFGEIKDNASDKLYEIRSQLRAATGMMQKTMRRVMDRAVADGIIDRDVTPAVRDGRMVIPVDASRKRSLTGIVHDSSATGKTVYIEPLEVIEASNRIKELEMEQHREEIEILKSIASQLRPHLSDIASMARMLGLYEFIMVKARFAIEVDGRMPIIERDRVLEWYNAVHPALLLTLRRQGRNVVPLNLTLDDKQRILIISGPNAGGKSVCLKTTGIVQYMMQCGLLPTLYENSHMGIFDNLYVDIGDEQSIENDLSTYSSHLKNMKYILRHSSRRTLLLIDEMGSGTEPQIGGALAQSILSKVVATGCMGIITTHYQNLKTFAAEHEGFINGAMLYDREHLKPTFQLSVGNPGSSFAIEIAHKIGLDNDIIEHAKEIVGSEYVNLDKYMLDIARDRRYWSNKRRNIKEKEAKLDHILEMYEGKSDELKSQRYEILRQAKDEAKEILATANAKIEKAIRDIRAASAEREKTREIRSELEAYKRAVISDDDNDDATLPEALHTQKHISRERRNKNRTATSSVAKETAPLSVGDTVKMTDSEIVGTIIRIEGKNAEVAFGSLRTKVKLNKLKRSNKQIANKALDTAYTLSGRTYEDSRRRQLDFKQEIDVRGMRGDEAVQAIIYFLDDAVQFGATRLRILHGTGHGILKTLIRQQLDIYPAVKSYHDEDVRFGGAGITVVDM